MRTSFITAGHSRPTRCPNPTLRRRFIRWITGNADPTGQLPWPFGTTDYLVWWANRKLAALAGLDSGARLFLAEPGGDARAAPGRGLDGRGLGPGGPPGSLLAALLPLADRRHGHHRGGLLGRRDLGSRSPVRIAETASRPLQAGETAPVDDRSCWRPSRLSF